MAFGTTVPKRVSPTYKEPMQSIEEATSSFKRNSPAMETHVPASKRPMPTSATLPRNKRQETMAPRSSDLGTDEASVITSELKPIEQPSQSSNTPVS